MGSETTMLVDGWLLWQWILLSTQQDGSSTSWIRWDVGNLPGMGHWHGMTVN